MLYKIVINLELIFLLLKKILYKFKFLLSYTLQILLKLLPMTLDFNQ